tara:strand:+ start:1107 stop:1493 length:387 start_codon:yes stop_codon:yes gene_type:complete
LSSLNLSYNDLGQDSILTLQPILSTIVELNLSSTKMTNKSLQDLVQTFKKQEMKLETLDIHSNQITTEGFYRLMVCLKANNKVKTLNISRNKIADDLKMFKQVHKFLNCNKVLENLDMSFCDINVKAA